MGTTLAIRNGHSMLYDHEGYLQFLDTTGEYWSSTWGHGALGSPGHDPVRVRAACECGWTGVELPWTAEAGCPDQQQEHALMSVWYHRHANPLREEAESRLRASRTVPLRPLEEE